MERSIKDAEKLFRCPVNKNTLELKDGIIDLLPKEERKQQ